MKCTKHSSNHEHWYRHYVMYWKVILYVYHYLQISSFWPTNLRKKYQLSNWIIMLYYPYSLVLVLRQYRCIKIVYQIYKPSKQLCNILIRMVTLATTNCKKNELTKPLDSIKCKQMYNVIIMFLDSVHSLNYFT